MIIVKLKGGLGNQIFQYALGRSLELRSGIPVQYDLSFYKAGVAARDTVRSLGLHNFNVSLTEAAPDRIKAHTTPLRKFIRKILARLSQPSWYTVDPHVYNAKDNSYLEDWWQTEEYFKEYAQTLREELTLARPLGVAAQSLYLKIKEIKEASQATVSLHIRRGDYVTNPHAAAHHGVLSLEYYHQALKEIQKKESKHLHVFVFSDDIEWAKQHITSTHPLTFVSSPDIEDFEELTLMSACMHHIIANSSFSWWGAWLNPSSEKIVVAPKQWITDPHVDTSHATPTTWIRI